MRDYGIIYSSFWEDPEIKGLSSKAMLFCTYLLTCRHANMIGCFRLPTAYISDDLNLSTDGTESVINELVSINFVAYDKANKWVLVHKYLKWNEIENPNQLDPAVKLLCNIPRQLSFFPQLKSIINHLETRASQFSENEKILNIKNKINSFVAENKPFLNPFETVSEPLPNSILTKKTQDFTVAEWSIIDQHEIASQKNDKTEETQQNQGVVNPFETVSEPLRNRIETSNSNSNSNSNSIYISDLKNKSDIVDSKNQLPTSEENISENPKKKTKTKKQEFPEFHQQVVKAYHDKLPMLPAVRAWTKARARKLETSRLHKFIDDRIKTNNVDWWEKYFGYIAEKCPYLHGDNENGWVPDIEWLVNHEKLTGVVEGKYANKNHK